MEHDIQTDILKYLDNIPKLFYWRNNTGAIHTEKRFVQFGVRGGPDIIIIYKGKFIGIEVKGPRGKQSEYQQSFQKNVEYAGGIYLVAKSVEDVKKII